MKSAKVTFNETLSRTITIEVPDSTKDALEYVADIARAKYLNSEVVLTADDFIGPALMEVSIEEINEYSDWEEIYND